MIETEQQEHRENRLEWRESPVFR